MAVTIMQIAERLQLSHSTVSRVLNNKPNVFVGEETRQRVLKLAREMGYRPNLAARSLRDARSNMVGIFSNPYSGIWSGGAGEICSALAEVLYPHDLHLFFAVVSEDGAEQKAMPVWRFDGAVLLQRPSEVMVEHLLTVDRPFVAINESVPEGISILADDSDGVRQAMGHLFELGHRRIAYVGANQWHFQHYSVSERHTAYLAYIAEHQMIPITGRDLVQPLDDTARRSQDVRLEWLRQAVEKEGATAVLAYDHMVLLEVLAAAQKLSLRIPQDLSLVCFNDDLIMDKLNPPITVVAPQNALMGREAGKLLLTRMNTGEGARPLSGSYPTQIRVPELLVIRESTGPAPR